LYLHPAQTIGTGQDSLSFTASHRASQEASQKKD
jgi:hypothetical protein